MDGGEKLSNPIFSVFRLSTDFSPEERVEAGIQYHFGSIINV